MKYLVIFVLCFVALATAAPQLVIPGVVSPTWGGGTIVAGPTVVNGVSPLGLGRVIAPGVLGVGII